MMLFAPLGKPESASATSGHRFSLAGHFGDLRHSPTYCKSLSSITLGVTSSWHRTCQFNRIMKQSAALLIAFAVLASPSLASAQGKGSRGKDDKDIPETMRPPAGMCRVWL